MHPTFDLNRVIDALVRIRAANQWEELERAIGEAISGPSRDLERWPQYTFAVNDTARFLSRITGVSEVVCREAACQRLLPWTRRSVALEIIEEFDTRLAEQEQAAAAAAKIARERAGRRTV